MPRQATGERLRRTLRRGVEVVQARRLPESLRVITRVPGMITLDEARLLHSLAGSVPPDGVIVEIGSYRGRSSVALARGSDASVAIYAIDPHESFVGELGATFGPADRAAFYRSMLRSGCWDRVRLVNLPSSMVARTWDRPVDLLWVDGDHSVEGVRRDWAAWSPRLARGAVVIIDDANQLGPGTLLHELSRLGWIERGAVGKVVALEAPDA